MGYVNLIRKSVSKAFATLKDLAVDVTLIQKSSNTFNFATNTTTLVTATKVIKGILVEKSSKDVSAFTREILFQAIDLDNPTIYDKFIMPNGEVWKAVPPYKNDGFIIKVDVAKES